jgi:hypothetical protein
LAAFLDRRAAEVGTIGRNQNSHADFLSKDVFREDYKLIFRRAKPRAVRLI